MSLPAGQLLLGHFERVVNRGNADFPRQTSAAGVRPATLAASDSVAPCPGSDRTAGFPVYPPTLTVPLVQTGRLDDVEVAIEIHDAVLAAIFTSNLR